MTISEAIELLKDERQKKLSHRFACRAIMVRNIAEYCELLSALHRVMKASQLHSMRGSGLCLQGSASTCASLARTKQKLSVLQSFGTIISHQVIRAALLSLFGDVKLSGMIMRCT